MDSSLHSFLNFNQRELWEDQMPVYAIIRDFVMIDPSGLLIKTLVAYGGGYTFDPDI